MITGNELLKDLETIKLKSEYIKNNLVNNKIWKKVDSMIEDTIKVIKTDKHMYRW